MNCLNTWSFAYKEIKELKSGITEVESIIILGILKLVGASAEMFNSSFFCCYCLFSFTFFRLLRKLLSFRGSHLLFFNSCRDDLTLGRTRRGWGNGLGGGGAEVFLTFSENMKHQHLTFLVAVRSSLAHILSYV